MYVKLYKGHTNSVGFWSIGVEEHDSGFAEIAILSATRIEGKAVLNSEVITEGKNIGKANETTPYQQAISEAFSRVKKQLDKGYVENIEDIKAYPTNALGHPMPVLAKPIEKVKKQDYTYAFVQPKLDGHRCPAIRLDNDVVMYSRQGKVIDTLPHIKEELMDTTSPGDRLDGELYKHGMTLQDISSAVKKSQDMSKEIEYHVYDAIDTDCSFEDRFYHRYYSDDKSGSIQTVETHPVTSLEEAWDWFSTFQAQGYEGAILRLGNQGYEIGRRSSNLLKLKGFEDAEYLIVNVSEGTPRTINGKQFRVAILHLITADGKPFTVTAPGTASEKQQPLFTPSEYIGKLITVKFANLTPDGIPFHPVAMRMREDI